MGKPWEKYKPQEQAAKPWEKFAPAANESASSEPIQAPIQEAQPNIQEVAEQGQTAGQQSDSFLKNTADVGNELISSFNRGVVNFADFLTTDQINEVLRLSGSEKRVPKFSDIPGSQGGYMEPGIGRDIAQATGEIASGFVNPTKQVKNIAEDLPDIAVSESSGIISKAKEYVSPLISKLTNKFKTKSGDPYQDIADAFKSGQGKNIMPEIMADPDIIKAADDLGLNVNPSVYSSSDAYREMENALKAIPASKLSVNEKDTVRKLGESADNLILEWTGTLDKSGISADFSERALKKVSRLEDEAEILYGMFNDVIPKKLPVEPKSSLGYITNQIDELGGIQNLDAPIAKIYKQISGPEKPTYALLDKLRKDIGSAAFKSQGPFKDASQNDLKLLYGTLTDDTMRGASLFGLDEEVKIAKQLVVKRKALEETLQGALGKDLSKSLMAELSSGVKQLQKGQPAKFDKVMAAVPVKDREEIAISTLNDIFTGGATKNKDFSLGGFVSSYEALARNGKASEKLYQYIPKEVKSRMDSIYKVSKGLMEANKRDLNNPSGTAKAVIGALDAPNGVIDKLFKVARHTTTAATSDMVKAVATSKTKATESAADMLSNPAFQQSMQKYIDGDLAGANKILNNMQSTKLWLSAQTPETKRTILRSGLLQYLLNEEESE